MVPHTQLALCHNDSKNYLLGEKQKAFSPDGKSVRGRDSLLGVEISTLSSFLLRIRLLQVTSMSLNLGHLPSVAIIALINITINLFKTYEVISVHARCSQSRTGDLRAQPDTKDGTKPLKDRFVNPSYGKSFSISVHTIILGCPKIPYSGVTHSSRSTFTFEGANNSHCNF